MKVKLLFVGLLAFALGAGAAYLFLTKTADSAGETPERSGLWTCGMHPEVIQNEPGLCPICNMKLTPLDVEQAPPAEHTSAAEGRTEVRVSPAFLQNFAVRTVKAERGAIPVEIRTVGSLRFNEKRIVSVNTIS